MSPRATNNRIPVTPDVHERLREFKNGLNVDYDAAIALLLGFVVQAGEDEHAAGKRLRALLQEQRHDTQTNTQTGE